MPGLHLVFGRCEVLGENKGGSPKKHSHDQKRTFIKGGRLLSRTMAFKWVLGFWRCPASSTVDVAPSRGTVEKLHGLLAAVVKRRQVAEISILPCPYELLIRDFPLPSLFTSGSIILYFQQGLA